MIKNLFFDLDGTLLPMDQEEFVRCYFAGLIGHMAPYGYDPHQLQAAIWKGVQAMYANSSQATNEEVFWQSIQQVYGSKILEDRPLFEAFYQTDFQKIAEVCPADPQSAPLIETLKPDYRLVLATNPLFPAIATLSRMKWAGLKEEDFEQVTVYETMHACKPNPAYFLELLQSLDMKPEETLMIGNDALEDLAARQAGMPVFLLTDHLINKTGVDLSTIPHGSKEDLLAFLQADRQKQPHA